MAERKSTPTMEGFYALDPNAHDCDEEVQTFELLSGLSAVANVLRETLDDNGPDRNDGLACAACALVAALRARYTAEEVIKKSKRSRAPRAAPKPPARRLQLAVDNEGGAS